MKQTAKPALVIVLSLGLYLFFTSTFFPLHLLAVFNAKRVLQLALFVSLTTLAVMWAPLRTATMAQLNRLSQPARYGLVLFFTLGLISSIRLPYPAYALADVAMLFLLILLIAVTAASRELCGERFDKWAVLLLAATGFAVALQEFMGFIAGWVLGFEFSYEQALIHFSHPRFYNQLQTWSLPMLAALPLVLPGKRWIKWLCVTLLGLQWFLLIALAARGSIVSLLAAMVFIALWLPAQRKFWLKSQLAGLVVGIGIYIGILLLNGWLLPQSQSGEFYAHSAGRSMLHTSGRSMFWRLSVEDALKHPVLGTGPANYACDAKTWVPAHPHNFPLTILGEWGFIAFFLLVTLALMIGLSFLKKLRSAHHTADAGQTGPPLRAMLAISVIAGALHACLSGLLIMPASQVALLLIAGWALSLSGPGVQSPKKPIAIKSVVVAGALISWAVFVFAGMEIPQLKHRTTYSENHGPQGPRFWARGSVCEYDYQTIGAHK
jgi:O-antigen ligase